MADPTRLIFIAANIFEATSTTEATPPSYPSTGTPGRDWYTVPDECFDAPPQRIYKPGPKRSQYPSYREQWRGWPSISYTFQFVDSAEFVLIMAQYINAKNLDGWVWFAQWNAQTRAYKCKLGQMEEPHVNNWQNGPLYGDVTVAFSKIKPTEYSL